MSIEHKVPLIGQVKNKLCWLAALQMLEAWYTGVLRKKRPAAYTPTQLVHLKKLNWGVRPGAIAGFARLMGLNIKKTTPDIPGVEALLATHGPIWYPAKINGYLPIGSHHVVVIRGVNKTDILINDPSPIGTGSKHAIPVATFFHQLQPLNNQFLVMLANSKPDTVAIYNDLKVK